MLPAEQIVLVLVEPQDVVNVGGVIRVMLNFGLQQLRLVRPAAGVVDPARLDDLAHRSDDIVGQLQIVDTLAAALVDVTFVAGTTARGRAQASRTTTPRAAALDLVQRANMGKLALVFGPESTGLANTDLDQCHVVLTIPTVPTYRSLNLAQAALLVCYELWLAGGSSVRTGLDTPPVQEQDRRSADRQSQVSDTPARVGDLEALFAETAHALQGIGFLKPGQETAVMRRLRSIVHRALPTTDETTLLRAIAREINKYIERQSP